MGVIFMYFFKFWVDIIFRYWKIAVHNNMILHTKQQIDGTKGILHIAFTNE